MYLIPPSHATPSPNAPPPSQTLLFADHSSVEALAALRQWGEWEDKSQTPNITITLFTNPFSATPHVPLQPSTVVKSPSPGYLSQHMGWVRVMGRAKQLYPRAIKAYDPAIHTQPFFDQSSPMGRTGPPPPRQARIKNTPHNNTPDDQHAARPGRWNSSAFKPNQKSKWQRKWW